MKKVSHRCQDILGFDIMDILFYMSRPHNIESTGMRTHIVEVLGNLHRMGHSIRYVDGELYSPIPLRELAPRQRDNSRQSLWTRAIKFASASPLKGETWLLWNLLKEFRVFFYSLRTVLRHRPEIIYWRDSHFNSDYLISRLFSIPLVKEVNSIGSNELKISGRADKLTLWLYRIIERYTTGRANAVIVVTPELKELIQRNYGVDPEKITVIQNGANIDLFRPMDQMKMREKLGLKQDIAYICFVGLLRRWQGVEYLIRSLPLILDQHPGTQLLIVGDGALLEELRETARQVGVSSNVIFTGGVPYEEVPFYINASDVCAAPFIKELDAKGGLCSLKMYEYLACGKPCVISKLSGIDTLDAYNCVIAVEPENVPELAKGVASLLQNSELRRQMGENGRKYIVENQSWEKVSQRVAKVLTDTVCSINGESRRNSDECKTATDQ